MDDRVIKIQKMTHPIGYWEIKPFSSIRKLTIQIPLLTSNSMTMKCR
jgi:hypothetical protein